MSCQNHELYQNYKLQYQVHESTSRLNLHLNPMFELNMFIVPIKNPTSIHIQYSHIRESYLIFHRCHFVQNCFILS